MEGILAAVMLTRGLGVVADSSLHGCIIQGAYRHRHGVRSRGLAHLGPENDSRVRAQVVGSTAGEVAPADTGAPVLEATALDVQRGQAHHVFECRVWCGES